MSGVHRQYASEYLSDGYQFRRLAAFDNSDIDRLADQARRRRWAAKNPAKAKAIIAEWKRRHPEKVRAARPARGATRTAASTRRCAPTRRGRRSEMPRSRRAANDRRRVAEYVAEAQAQLAQAQRKIAASAEPPDVLALTLARASAIEWLDRAIAHARGVDCDACDGHDADALRGAA